MLTGRSLNLVDIEKKFNDTGIATRDAYIGTGNIQYGHTNNYGNSNVPDMFDHTGITSEEESKDYYTSPTSATHSDKGSLTVTQTYYYLSPTDWANSFDDKTFHELVFSTEKNFWLATRYVDCDRKGYASFGLRYVSSSYPLRLWLVLFVRRPGHN